MNSDSARPIDNNSDSGSDTNAEQPNPEPSICPANCPNRASRDPKPAVVGQAGGVIFGIACLLLCLLASFEVKDKHWQPRQEIPVFAWVVLLPMAGMAFGVRLDSEQVGQMIVSIAEKITK